MLEFDEDMVLESDTTVGIAPASVSFEVWADVADSLRERLDSERYFAKLAKDSLGRAYRRIEELEQMVALLKDIIRDDDRGNGAGAGNGGTK